MLWAIAFATPFFVLFGWLSDKIGRKWIMMAGMLLGVLFYRPIFSEFLSSSKVDEGMIESYGVIEESELSRKAIVLNNNSDSVVNYVQQLSLPDGWQFTRSQTDSLFYKSKKVVTSIKYTNIKLGNLIYFEFIFLVWVMIIMVTMVYGPIAAFLVELFPTKIRYTSMSLPYHIGNGVFGGLVPFIGVLLSTTFTKDPLVGLWYPIGVAALCFLIGTIYLSNKIDKDVTD